MRQGIPAKKTDGYQRYKKGLKLNVNQKIRIKIKKIYAAYNMLIIVTYIIFGTNHNHIIVTNLATCETKVFVVIFYFFQIEQNESKQ